MRPISPHASLNIQFLTFGAEAKKEPNHNDLALFFVALEGFEPSQAEPESDVLPLHHKARFVSLLRLQSYVLLPYLPNFLSTIFDLF